MNSSACDPGAADAQVAEERDPAPISGGGGGPFQLSAARYTLPTRVHDHHRAADRWHPLPDDRLDLGSNTSPRQSRYRRVGGDEDARPNPRSMAVDTKVTGEPWSPVTVAVVVCCPDRGAQNALTDARPFDAVLTALGGNAPASLRGPLDGHAWNPVVPFRR